MKGSVKLFIASLVVLAAAIGFFTGSVICKPCPKGPMTMEGMMPPPPPGFDGQFPPGPNGKLPPPSPDTNNRQESYDDIGKGHGPKGPNTAKIDSVLQVTPEQKIALDQQRTKIDSTIKILREQKMTAEKALREALDSKDDQKILESKASILKVQEAMLDTRIAGAKDLDRILTEEQQAKLQDFEKRKFKKSFLGHHMQLKKNKI